MIKSQSKLKAQLWRKNYENKAAHEWTWKIFSFKQQMTTSDLQPECTTWKHKVKCGSSQGKCSVKTAVLKNFTIFTRKHLCWDLFLTKLSCRPSGLRKTFFKKHLQKGAA